MSAPAGPPRRFVLPADALAGVEAGAYALPEALAHHVARVLRLEVGAPVELTDGCGREAVGWLSHVGKRAAQVAIDVTRNAPPPPRPEIHLLQGVGKGEKLDTVIRQASELGVTAIWPVLSVRTVAARTQKMDRFRTIADDALRVSRRAHRTEVHSPRSLPEVLQLSADRKLAFIVGGEEDARTALQGPPPERLALLVGPEGGFDAEERAEILSAGFAPVHLGPHVLRTETAGPAVVAMARFAYGFA